MARFSDPAMEKEYQDELARKAQTPPGASMWGRAAGAVGLGNPQSPSIATPVSAPVSTDDEINKRLKASPWNRGGIIGGIR